MLREDLSFLLPFLRTISRSSSTSSSDRSSNQSFLRRSRRPMACPSFAGPAGQLPLGHDRPPVPLLPFPGAQTLIQTKASPPGKTGWGEGKWHSMESNEQRGEGSWRLWGHLKTSIEQHIHCGQNLFFFQTWTHVFVAEALLMVTTWNTHYYFCWRL